MSKPRGLNKVQCRMRAIRESQGVSLREVAAVTGLAPSMLSVIERGADVCLTTALKLTSYYRVSLDAIWGETS